MLNPYEYSPEKLMGVQNVGRAEVVKTLRVLLISSYVVSSTMH